MMDSNMSSTGTEYNVPAHAGVASFLRRRIIAPQKASLLEAKADVAVLGFPFDTGTLSRTGSTLGPRSIRDFSTHFLAYHFDLNVDISEKFSIVDCADFPVVPGNSEKTFKLAESVLAEVYSAGAMPIVLGGDHSITIPCVRALSKNTKGNIGIIVFDTHTDAADDVVGERLTHASPIARHCELANVRPENIVLIGIHGMLNPQSDKEFLNQKAVSVFSVEAVMDAGIERVSNHALELASKDTESVYLSVDIDCLDPAYAPGTCDPEPGGLTSRELLSSLRTIASKARLGAMDVVELSPPYDSTGITARIATRCILDVLASMSHEKLDPSVRSRLTR